MWALRLLAVCIVPAGSGPSVDSGALDFLMFIRTEFQNDNNNVVCAHVGRLG